jgi:hypothetical protein
VLLILARPVAQTTPLRLRYGRWPGLTLAGLCNAVSFGRYAWVIHGALCLADLACLALAPGRTIDVGLTLVASCALRAVLPVPEGLWRPDYQERWADDQDRCNAHARVAYYWLTPRP